MSGGLLSRAGSPGVFGKLPSAGDFLRLGVGAGAAGALDAWLDAGFTALESDEPDWRDAFPQGPSWRFAAEPGVAGADAVAGVMRPSVDSAGRLFPCAAVAASEALTLADAAAAVTWYDRVETVLAAGADGRGGNALAAELEALGPPEADEADAMVMRTRSTGDGLFVDAEAGDGRADALAAVLAAVALPQSASLWWRHAGGHVRLMACEGLPRGKAFAALFRGAPPAAAPAPIVADDPAPPPAAVVAG